ncbi:hypothetical protein BDV98DRAFT_503935, partial [Pterulicium gracile]
PIPAHECSVTPPMFTAAIPVVAVTPILSSRGPPKWSIMERRRTDLPVPNIPALPVKNTFCPDLTRSMTICCSSERRTAWTRGTPPSTVDDCAFSWLRRISSSSREVFARSRAGITAAVALSSRSSGGSGGKCLRRGVSMYGGRGLRVTWTTV